MKKKRFVLAFLIISVMIAGLVVAGGEKVSKTISDYVSHFVEKKGINPAKINNITEVNFEDLPKEVSIKNLGDTNLAIYQVNYNQSISNLSLEEQKKIFVIAYSTEKLNSQGDIIIFRDKREFLNFGFVGEKKESGFLNMASGVNGSSKKGYVMMRSGSITGMSTNLEILSGVGSVELTIYKNGEEILFGNSFIVKSAGVLSDYDTQSTETVWFESGDIISIHLKSSEGVLWKDVTTLLEITAD